MNSNELADLVVTALDDLKGIDITTIDVREKTTVTDTLVIASGTSERHIRALADRVIDNVREAGMKPIGVEGDKGADWVLIDLGDVVVHVMHPDRRDFYNLEKLWSLDTRDSAAGEEGL